MVSYSLVTEDKKGTVSFWTDDPELLKTVVSQIELVIDAEKCRREKQKEIRKVKRV